jgi:hypothetical protein
MEEDIEAEWKGDWKRVLGGWNYLLFGGLHFQ